MLRRLACGVITLGVAVGCAKGTDDPAQDRAAIEAALKQWPSDFDAENLAGVCGLFADDVVLVDRDLATVRLVWTLTVRDTSGKVLETVDENGVDVFRRQADGSWKIHISHAFTQN